MLPIGLQDEQSGLHKTDPWKRWKKRDTSRIFGGTSWTLFLGLFISFRLHCFRGTKGSEPEPSMLSHSLSLVMLHFPVPFTSLVSIFWYFAVFVSAFWNSLASPSSRPIMIKGWHSLACTLQNDVRIHSLNPCLIHFSLRLSSELFGSSLFWSWCSRLPFGRKDTSTSCAQTVPLHPPLRDILILSTLYLKP